MLTNVLLLSIEETYVGLVANIPTLGPSSTLPKPVRLVLNKQLDIEKGVRETPFAVAQLSDLSSEVIIPLSHAIEVGT